MLQRAKKAWHGVKLDQPDWSDTSKSIAASGEIKRDNIQFHYMLNAHHEPLEFELPRLTVGYWKRWIDTALDSPADIGTWEQAQDVTGTTYRVVDRSVVMLIADS